MTESHGGDPGRDREEGPPRQSGATGPDRREPGRAGAGRAGRPDGGQAGRRDLRDPDSLVARAGRGDPGRDQHFLVDDRVLDRLPAYAAEVGMDLGHVLEIGAGAGALTDRLLAATAGDLAGAEPAEGSGAAPGRVTAVERDPDLAAFLREEFRAEREAGRLTVVEGDALTVDLPAFTACVSNLPYGVSSEIAFRLLPLGRPMVLTFQREFAERMVAGPSSPEYGRLSVTAGHYADAEIVEVVPREAFDPPPAVESAVVRLLPREPDYEVDDEAFFLGFVKALFTQRRKTLRNAIRNTAHISGVADPEAVVAAVDDDLLGRRPGTLAPETFARLARLARETGPE